MFMQHKNRYDTVIVGAGPAGATAGYLLAKAGLRVLILDKKRFPRPKLCGGLITWKTVQLLKQIFGSNVETLKTAKVIAHKSGRYAVCSHDNRSIVGNLEFPFHFVNRRRYDSVWLERARSAGAKLIAPAAVSSIDVEKPMVATRDGGRYYGRFILGADGALSRVKSALIRQGCLNPQTRPGLARAIEVVVPQEKAAGLPDYPRIYYGYVPRGYAWTFPGPGYQLMGIAGLRSKSSGSLLTALQRLAASLSISIPTDARLQAAPLPYGNFLKKPGWRNILLLGDAGGLVDPLLGEGIFHAHRSAQLAAGAIIASSQDHSDALEHYGDALARLIIPDLRYARAGRNMVYALPKKWYYPVLTCFLRLIRKACEETIQGRRTYLWFRKAKSLNSFNR
jgi:geranylgeranyl reductase family protein